MFNLLNRGIIPKDVDLTPAFEKKAAPVICRGSVLISVSGAPSLISFTYWRNFYLPMG